MRSVRACCRYCDRRPAELTFEDVRQYQLHLTQSGLTPANINGPMVLLRFFFRVTLKRPEAIDYIPIVRIRVEQGKGRRDRDALLSPHLLATLRNWWKVARPPVWLFPNRLSQIRPARRLCPRRCRRRRR